MSTNDGGADVLFSLAFAPGMQPSSSLWLCQVFNSTWVLGVELNLTCTSFYVHVHVHLFLVG